MVITSTNKSTCVLSIALSSEDAETLIIPEAPL